MSVSIEQLLANTAVENKKVTVSDLKKLLASLGVKGYSGLKKDECFDKLIELGHDIKAPKAKAPKDSDAPKKPRSAYIFFSMEEGAKIRKSKPDLKQPAVAKECGARWKKLGDKQKKKFLDLANTDKERYQKEMKKYQPSEEFLEKKAAADAKKGKRGKSGVKRGKSSFMFFSVEVRPQVKNDNPDLTFGEIAKEIGRMWKALSDEEKAPYVKMAADAKAALPKAEPKAKAKAAPKAKGKAKEEPKAKAKAKAKAAPKKKEEKEEESEYSSSEEEEEEFVDASDEDVSEEVESEEEEEEEIEEESEEVVPVKKGKGKGKK